MLLLEGDDLLFDGRGEFGTATLRPGIRLLQPRFAKLSVATDPRGNGTNGNLQFLGDQLHWKPFFQPQLNRLQPHREWMGPPRKPPRGLRVRLRTF